jgi:hypothetical protein
VNLDRIPIQGMGNSLFERTFPGCFFAVGMDLLILASLLSVVVRLHSLVRLDDRDGMLAGCE